MTVTSVDDEVVRLRDQIVHLELAMQTRPAIEQAKGMLMSRYGVDDTIAFSILQRWSSTTNLKLRDLALALVEIAVDRGSACADRPAVGAVRAELALAGPHAACRGERGVRESM